MKHPPGFRHNAKLHDRATFPQLDPVPVAKTHGGRNPLTVYKSPVQAAQVLNEPTLGIDVDGRMPPRNV